MPYQSTTVPAKKNSQLVNLGSSSVQESGERGSTLVSSHRISQPKHSERLKLMLMLMNSPVEWPHTWMHSSATLRHKS